MDSLTGHSCGVEGTTADNKVDTVDKMASNATTTKEKTDWAFHAPAFASKGESLSPTWSLDPVCVMVIGYHKL